MTDDMTLAREAQLVFTNTPGWSPAGDSLSHWRGQIHTSTGNFEFEVFLPEFFPNVPPVVQCVTPASHPNFDSECFVKMRILESWRAEFHVYQVINALKGLIARVPPIFEKDKRIASVSFAQQRKAHPSPDVTASHPEIAQKPVQQPQISQAEVSSLREELGRMKDEITLRDEELARLRARRAFGIEEEAKGMVSPVPAPSRTEVTLRGEVDPIVALESERVALSELLASLHEKYSSGEASVYDFSRLYKKYARDLYIVTQKLEFMRQKRR